MRRKQRGDTIIEVLLAMSVIGMVLGTSYAIANRSLGIGRLAQEQTEALKIAETQLEKLKTLNTTKKVVSDVNSSEVFCMSKSGIEKLAGGSSGCNSGFYTPTITYYPNIATTEAYFEVKVTWEREGSKEPGVTQLFYKLETGK